MTGLDMLVGGPDRNTRQVTARGRVVKGPDALDSPLTVVVQNFSGSYEYEIPSLNWSPRGATLPEIGDECLVVFDDEGDAWVPTWTGFTTASSGGGDKNYVHTQSAAAATWTVIHNLGKFPAVEVVDSGGSTLITDVHYIDTNQLTVSFGSPTSGKVYVN